MARLVGTCVLFAVLASAFGCEGTCPSGKRSVGADHTCIDNDQADPNALLDEAPPDAGDSYPMPVPASLPPPSLPEDASSPTPAPTCETLGAALADILVVVKTGAQASSMTELAPPDGQYVLVQASAYPTDPSGSPIPKVRASLSVKSAKIVLGIQATKDGKLGTNESFTFTLATSSIVKFCEMGAGGSVSSFWFPGGEGVKRPAKIVWDEATKNFTLVVRTPFGDVELVFAKT